jgi:universal stress protein A
MANYKKVLLCTDFSDASLKALDKSIPLANSFEAEVHICHVVSPVAAIPVHGYYYPLNIDLEKDVLHEAEKKMGDVTSNLKIEKKNIHVFFGDPKESIVSFSKEKEIDLVIVAGHHHSFIGMLGSTANYIANKIHCDVLIINS